MFLLIVGLAVTGRVHAGTAGERNARSIPDRWIL